MTPTWQQKCALLGESALALDDIFETMKQCGLFEPHARAVWFIDAEEEYQQFRRIVIDQLCEYPPLELCRSPLFTAEEALLGLPIRVWSLREIEERISSAIVDELNKHIAPAKMLEIVGRSFPFRRPGVFVEMSDGNHLEIMMACGGFRPRQITKEGHQ
jgi:hypothetical protein